MCSETGKTLAQKITLAAVRRIPAKRPQGDGRRKRPDYKTHSPLTFLGPLLHPTRDGHHSPPTIFDYNQKRRVRRYAFRSSSNPSTVAAGGFLDASPCSARVVTVRFMINRHFDAVPDLVVYSPDCNRGPLNKNIRR